ncbi:MAG: oxygen-independent coproporphyrinogen III oxidase, partial [Candidatus Obscuribacterales bacterium]|nr:oxygen-independent coproporphyrinogen III oxidase [Candidatus Obscuribacterales bacterium]
MAKSAYIHIPFCSHKCDFCDFAAFAGVDDLSQEYCQIVCREIVERLKDDPNEESLSTVFFGG